MKNVKLIESEPDPDIIVDNFVQQPFSLKMEPKNESYLSESWNGSSVYYTPQTMGARRLFVDDFLTLIDMLPFQPPRETTNLLEWRSGPGFIGYALMAHGICSRLTLAECHEPSLRAVTHTAQSNGITGLVTIRNDLNLSPLPPDDQFDLIVSNPPYFPNRVMQEEIYKRDPKSDPHLYVDENWHLHKKLFADARHVLHQNGLMILLESTNASHHETFRPMIESSGLRIAGWRWATICGTSMWYLFVTRADTTNAFSISA